MHPGGEVNFRKRGSKFSLPLSHRHQTLHVTLREVKFTKGGTHSSGYIPLPPSPSPFPSTHTHTHTRMRQTPDTPLSGGQVYIKGYICYHPANDSRSGSKFPKKLWCCVSGGYNKMIWFYKLNWKCELATVKVSKEDILSVSTRGLTSQMLA